MTITLGRNRVAESTLGALGKSLDVTARVTERLATGQRINRASDDAAGLAISSSLRADARIFNQALRNLNDGVSFLAIAEGGLRELSAITVRLQELATQSSNGVYTTAQRSALDSEAQALANEYNTCERIQSDPRYSQVQRDADHR